MKEANILIQRRDSFSLQATLRELLDAGIAIAGARKVQLTREKAQKLYETHRGSMISKLQTQS